MGKTFEKKLPYKKAICYSGYREGQCPTDRRNAIERTDLRRPASACSGRLWLYPYV